jgi:Protein of unknown function (DUF3036).
MWNKDKSLLVTLALVRAFLFLIPPLCICAPWMARWYDLTELDRMGLMRGSVFVPLLTALYIGAVCGEICLYFLLKLLKNIRKEQVFIQENCKCLRYISWCCLAAAVPFFVFGFWRFISFAIALAAAFFGIILRVVKNVFEQAVALQEENDYTI